MTRTRTFQEYQAEKREREWNDKVRKQKEAMGNAERVSKATEWKRIGNEKFKAGNFFEAREYYREAIIFVEDLVDARRRERNDLLVPLYSNLAQVHLKLDENEMAEDVTTKALVIAEVPRNNIHASFKAKAHFRRAAARRCLGKLEEARDDLAAASRFQPEDESVTAELAIVREQLAAQAKKAREAMGGFLNREADEREKKRRQEEKRRRAEELRKERRARAEQRQQMQQAFQKISEGKMLYEKREQEMEPIREKEREKQKTLELERDLRNIIDESKSLPKTEDLDDFKKKKEAECHEQSDELDQKKKVLDKLKKEEQWVEDDSWKGQRDDHRRRLQAEREEGILPVGPSSMWESREVARWCEQRLRDMLVGIDVQGPELDPELAAEALGSEESRTGYVLRAIITDMLKLVGDAAVMRLNTHKPPIFYYDYFIKLDWEVAVCKRDQRNAYRTAEELIQVAAKIDDGKAPPSVAENRVFAGTFKIREFCSEEEPTDGASWQLATKVKRPCQKGERIEKLSEELRDRLRQNAEGLLGKWADEYRKHWAL